MEVITLEFRAESLLRNINSTKGFNEQTILLLLTAHQFQKQTTKVLKSQFFVKAELTGMFKLGQLLRSGWATQLYFYQVYAT